MATGENQEARGKGSCSSTGLAVHLLRTGTMPAGVQVGPAEARAGDISCFETGEKGGWDTMGSHEMVGSGPRLGWA